MGWESIVGFLIIIAINTLIGKNKNDKRQQRRSGPAPQQGPAQTQPRQARPQQPSSQPQSQPTARPQATGRPKPAPARQNRPSQPRTILEELFQELETELRGPANRPAPAPKPQPVEQKAVEVPIESEWPQEEEDYFAQSALPPISMDSENLAPLVVSDTEPVKGPTGKNLFANRNAVIQGIVMAEVLGKPKSLR